MKILRRVRGVTKEERLRSVAILRDLKTVKLSEMIEERQLRYLGHVWRYEDARWTKFMLQAERPSQKKGKQRQYRKHITNLLKSKGLNTGMMLDGKAWGSTLKELYPRGKEVEVIVANPNPGVNNIEIQV